MRSSLVCIVSFAAKVKKVFVSIRPRYMLSADEQAYAMATGKIQKKKSAKKAANVVLVQCVEDYYYMGLFAIIVAGLRQKEDIFVEQFLCRNLRLAASASFKELIFSLLYTNRFTDAKWTRLYGAFCDGIAFRTIGFGLSINAVTEVFKAWMAWRGLRSKKDLLNMNIDGLAVGDLIYDSYLRFKPAKTVDINSYYLMVVIWQAHRSMRIAKHYLERVKPRLFFSSYSSYIQHGIPVRVALSLGVKVFSLGNYQEFLKELTLDDWFHARAYKQYGREWKELGDHSGKLIQAEQGLSARISGKIDSATAYMRKSAYTNSGESVPDVRGALVVFMHDFFDSPHCYQWMLFPDFWEWVVHTNHLAEENGLNIFWKPHPNQIVGSGEVVEQFVALNPNIKILSSGITNKQLVDAGIACALTVYGTVAHEMAFLGVPVIACGDHPHISFDFCFTAKTIEEYDFLVTNYENLDFDAKEMRRQSLEFYFMHSLAASESRRSFLKSVESYRVAFYSGKPPPDGALFWTLLSSMYEQPAFAECLEECWDRTSLAPLN